MHVFRASSHALEIVFQAVPGFYTAVSPYKGFVLVR